MSDEGLKVPNGSEVEITPALYEHLLMDGKIEVNGTLTVIDNKSTDD